MRSFGAKIAIGQAVVVCACGGGGSGGVDGAQSEAIEVVYGAPGDTTATLRWAASSDYRVRGYRVYLGNGSRFYFQSKGAGIDVGPATTYQMRDLRASTTYYFAVTGYDEAGRESTYSNEGAKVIP